MLRIGLIDLFVMGSCIVTILGYYNSRKKKVRNRLTATFVGGPLDGQSKGVSRYNAIYTHKDLSQPGDAVYKNRGDGIYEFDEYVEG